MENKTLLVMRKIKCHLKSGEVIEYWQYEIDDRILAAEEYEDIKDGQMIYLDHIDDPNNEFSAVAVPKEHIDYFFDTGICVAALPYEYQVKNSQLVGWQYAKKENRKNENI